MCVPPFWITVSEVSVDSLLTLTFVGGGQAVHGVELGEVVNTGRGNCPLPWWLEGRKEEGEKGCDFHSPFKGTLYLL